MVIAAGTAGALLVAAGADRALRSDDAAQGTAAAVTTLLLAPVTSAASPVPSSVLTPGRASIDPTTPAVAPPPTTATRPTTTAATTPPLTVPPSTTVVFTAVSGLLRIVATAPEGARSAAAVAIDDIGTLVTSIGAVVGASTVTVVLPDGQAVPAEVLGTDGGSGIAVLSVAAPTMKANLGRAAALRAGSAISTAWPSSANGTVAELGRRASAASGETMHHLLLLTLPTASSVSEGEPLLDSGGAVVGVCTKDVDGTLLAVPIELARAAARSLRAIGRVAVPWLGIGGSDSDGGPVVGDVQDASPAAVGGLRDGDVVVSVDGQLVGTMDALVLSVRDHIAGEQARLGVKRDGTPLELTVTLGEKPSASP